MVFDGTMDFLGSYFRTVLYKTMKEEDFVGTEVPKCFGIFEKLLKKHNDGKEWVVSTLSFADLALFQIVDRYVTVAGAGSVEGYPALKGVHDRVANLPRIAEFLKSDRRFN